MILEKYASGLDENTELISEDGLWWMVREVIKPNMAII